MYVGIDLGTSCIKLSVLDDALQCTAREEFNIGELYCSPDGISDILKDGLSDLINQTLPVRQRAKLKGIGVSGCLPSGVFLDPDSGLARLGFTHVDPLPFRVSIHSGTLDTRVRKRRRRTRYWCEVSEILGTFGDSTSELMLLPLHSYVIWLLSNRLALDTISAFELGLFPKTSEPRQIRIKSQYAQSLKIPRVCPPSCVVGTTKNSLFPGGIPMVCGTYDTVCSALGAGVRHSRNIMFYYGSYFVVHQVNQSIANLLTSERLTHPPYTALMVLPRAGLLLDNVCSLLRLDRSKGGHPLDFLAERIQRVPELPKFRIQPSTKIHTGMQPAADLQGVTLGTTTDELGMSLLASYGQAIDRENLAEAIRNEKIYAAGGGSRSRGWMQITTNIIGARQHRHTHRLGADGTALLARFGINGELPDCEDEDCDLVVPN